MAHHKSKRNITQTKKINQIVFTKLDWYLNRNEKNYSNKNAAEWQFINETKISWMK